MSTSGLKILFLDSVHPCLEQMLVGAGFVCHHNYKSSSSEIAQIIGDYTGIVIRSRFPVDEKFLSAANQLKFIARAGAGMENINVEFAKSRGIALFNSPEGNRDAVGEHAVGMLLMLLNHLKKADAEVRKGIWLRAENRGTELGNKTVGIIGYGQMGIAFAQKLSGFGCRILAHDKYLKGFGNDRVQEVTLEELKQHADIISLHLPLSEETNYYIDELFINSCAKNFYLINTARGQNVKTSALVSALKTGKVLGACLDVLEYEKSSFENIDTDFLPADFKFLIESELVILSPHIAGWTHESHEKLSRFLGDKILHYFDASNKLNT
jgi:D-3-phosphoglycerate dehydrogenase / 2-oxoglutarate reductase